MEMEDHRDHHEYGMADLRQLMNGRSSHHFPAAAIPPQPTTTTELFSTAAAHRVGLSAGQQPYDMMMMAAGGRQLVLPAHEINMPRAGGGLHHHHHHHHSHHEFRCDSAGNTNSTASMTTVNNSAPSSLSAGGGLEADTVGGDGGTGRWPRQETLTLLEIRSRLDFKFKEANQKGPLWDEVSRYIFIYIYVTHHNPYIYIFTCCSFFYWLCILLYTL